MQQDSIERILVTEEQIRVRIKELGAQITQDYRNSEGILAVGILKGAVVYYADLVRQIGLPVSMDFLSCSGYGSGASSSGVVRINKDLDKDPVGKDILIVEDIIDSGLTLKYLKDLLWDRKPNSLRICCLLDKPSRRKAEIAPDYVGFSIPDEFVVGYGLDYNECFRNLPDICVLKPEVYGGR